MNALQQLESLKGQLNYVTDILNNNKCRSFEVWEYVLLMENYNKEIATLQLHIDSNPQIFKA